jgi:hypothetical protein
MGTNVQFASTIVHTSGGQRELQLVCGLADVAGDLHEVLTGCDLLQVQSSETSTARWCGDVATLQQLLR